MANGEMSFSKVRALTRKATPENEGSLLEVARHATAARTEALIQCWSRVDRLEEAKNEELRHRSRFLQLYPDQDGSYRIRGRLDPEVGALLETALEWAAKELYRKEPEGETREDGREPGENEGTRESAPSFGQRRADALGLVAERALAESEAETPNAIARSSTETAENVAITGREIEEAEGGSNRRLPRSSNHPFQIVVHVGAADLKAEGPSSGRGLAAVEAGTLCEPIQGKSVPAGTPGTECDHGSPASDVTRGDFSAHIVTRRTTIPCAHETARRLSCDAGVVLMAHGAKGGVLDVGRKRRTIPPAIHRALEYRDRGCRFPGCGCRFADAHHIVHWADGGETKLENLILVCRRHHRALHEEGYGVEAVACAGVKGESVIGPEITFRFLSPNGRVIPEVPTSPPVPPDPVASMVRKHAEEGIEPHEWTATPQWHGEVLDYGLAIDMFRGTFPRERGL
jgi:hypothetical protein